MRVYENSTETTLYKNSLTDTLYAHSQLAQQIDNEHINCGNTLAQRAALTMTHQWSVSEKATNTRHTAQQINT